ncbi:splicing factor 3A subunit 3 [Polychaeton citri CBS 116435]|uniref:Splicing factor 3A subunit 3 n=1 Tax=Polychaeton citri CBS 116435 TaxID=1314669 RepID=A0A9P4UN37_9PEZI|nr:splicing factor 3A subunit 3 [Polychaeton citri CBS 116435]
MIHEDLRSCHEDIERLEQAIADRVLDEPKHIRYRLIRDHEIASMLGRIQAQSERALKTYNQQQEAMTAEIQSLSTGDPFEEFRKQLNEIKDFHKRYPNEPVENLERAYKKPEHGGPPLGSAMGGMDIDNMFTGEEAWGRFLDLTMLHEEYLNLPGVKSVRKPTYLQYLDIFDVFTPPQNPMTRKEKMTEAYFSYATSLAEYLEGFLRKTKPLEDLDKMLKDVDDEFAQKWEQDAIPTWEAPRKVTVEGSGEGIWCADCQKEFATDGSYKGHLNGRKHKRAAGLRQSGQQTGDSPAINGTDNNSMTRLKEKAVAEREFRIQKLTATLQDYQQDTRVNVERKAGMTDKERHQEIQALYEEDQEMMAAVQGVGDEGSDDEDERVYNPLKLPLAWDGKPIPYWLYKLHGLGVEFPCEVCGNYVYMGRRAFDKHFSEPRHLYGLKCLGITGQTGLFREVTSIEEAQKLWEKIKRDKQKGKERGENVIEMEDSQGNVMPLRVYEDLATAGLL